jgi:hypothetical protein
MEHLDARGGSLTDNPANAGPEGADQQGAELDRALAHAIRRLIAQSRDTVDAASGV